MSCRFLREHVATIPLSGMCEVLGVSRSGYYDWASRAESERAAADRALVKEIRAVHAALRAHGRRRFRQALVPIPRLILCV